MIQVKGHTGEIRFDGHTVTIIRRGFAARATVGKGEKQIPVAAISAVQWKPAGAMVNGFIQFTIAGGVESRSRFGAQTVDAVKDENSVVFTRRQQPEFERLRAEVQRAVSAGFGSPPAAPVGGSVADELAKLADLYRQGLLSEAEFAAQKQRLLG